MLGIGRTSKISGYFFLFVSVKTVGNGTVMMMMILAGNANSLTLLLGMRKREKMNEKWMGHCDCIAEGQVLNPCSDAKIKADSDASLVLPSLSSLL